MAGLPTGLLPVAQANHVDASDFFAFGKANMIGTNDLKADDPNCDGSNEKQVDISGSTSEFFGRVHSNADLAITGQNNNFNDPVSYGTNAEDCELDVDPTTDGPGGVDLVVTELDVSPAGVGVCGWPGNLGTFLNADCETIAFDAQDPDHAFGLQCDIGSLTNGSDIDLKPSTAAHAEIFDGDEVGLVVCNGPNTTTKIAESGTQADDLDARLTVISRGKVEFSGQFLDLAPAHFPLLVATDQPTSAVNPSALLNGSNMRIFERSIIFTPRSGIDVSGSNQLGLCVQLIGQGSIKAGAGSVQNFGSSGPQCAPEDNPDIDQPKEPDEGDPGSLITVGENAEFTITVSNDGQGPAENVTLSDQLPLAAELDWNLVSVINEANVNVTASNLCAVSPGDLLTCDFDDMAVGQAFTITVAADTGDLCLQRQPGEVVELPNTSTTSADNHIDVSDDGFIAVQCGNITQPKEPDEGDIDAVVSAGEDAEFTITVNNAGPGIAENVTLSDQLPLAAELDWNLVSVINQANVNVTASNFCAVSPGDLLTCDFDDMAADTSFTITVAADTGDLCLTREPGAVIELPNTSTTSADNHLDVSDDGFIEVECPDVEQPKEPDEGELDAVIEAGTDAEFTITVTNFGPGTAQNVSVSDQLPLAAELDWNLVSVVNQANVNVTASNFCAVSPSDLLTCDFDDMAPNTSFTITVAADTADLCLERAPGAVVELPNTSTTSGDNFLDVTDEGFIEVSCPGVVIVRKRVNGSLAHNVQFTFSLYEGTRDPNEVPLDTQTTNDGVGTELIFSDLEPGTYTLCETVPDGYSSDLGVGVTIGPGEACETFVLAEDDVIFDVNNIPCPEGGAVAITKDIPAGSAPATFRYTLNIPGDNDPSIDLEFTGNETTENGVLNTPAGLVGTFTLTETELGSPDKFAPNAARQVSIQPPDCGGPQAFQATLVPNASARVIKTEEPVRGQRRNAIGKWTFTLTGGPSDITRVKKTNTKGANHVLRFNNLLPGDYTLCEKFFRGWKSNLAKKYGGTNLPSGNQCVDFTLQSNGKRTFRVNNACPTGRRAPGT